jgi:polar amino acid transport system substrate-binding protein
VACRRQPATRTWDIALLAAGPDRAASIDFAPAYCEIQATCMVPDVSPLATSDNTNQDGACVSVKGGGAYDL